MFLKPKKEVNKLVLVLATSTLVITIREEIVETTETIETAATAKAGEIGEDVEYLETKLAGLLYICYRIIF